MNTAAYVALAVSFIAVSGLFAYLFRLPSDKDEANDEEDRDQHTKHA